MIESLGEFLHSVRLRTTYQLYLSVITEAELGGALFIICVMICVVTTGFTIHHLWLLSTGTTTNESFKWADLKDALAAGEIAVLGPDDPFMYPSSLSHWNYGSLTHRVNRISRIVPLDPPTGNDDDETSVEKTCRDHLVRDTTRGARIWTDIDNIYASESRWRNLVDGVKGGNVLPPWQKPSNPWIKPKD